MGESYDRRIQRLEDTLGVHPRGTLELLIRASYEEPEALAFLIRVPADDPLLRLMMRPGWMH